MNIHHAAIAIVEKLEADMLNRGFFEGFDEDDIVAIRKAWLLIVLHELEAAKKRSLDPQ